MIWIFPRVQSLLFEFRPVQKLSRIPNKTVTNDNLSKGYYLLAYDVPRRLVYRRGMNPPVSWDWWIDPKSSTYLVREEFKHMAILGNNYDLHFLGWKGQWPLRYPAWSDHYYYYEDEIARSNRKLLQKRAHERANRRMEKKLREAARAQEIKERHGMPGAWPV